jgi:hypothetical protein
LDTSEARSVVGAQYLVDKPILNGFGTCKRKHDDSDLHRQARLTTLSINLLTGSRLAAMGKVEPPAKLPMA